MFTTVNFAYSTVLLHLTSCHRIINSLANYYDAYKVLARMATTTNDDDDRKCQKTEVDITSEIEFVDIFRVSHENKIKNRQERTSNRRRKRRKRRGSADTKQITLMGEQVKKVLALR